MPKSLRDVIAALPADERAKVEARTLALIKATYHPSELPEHLKQAIANAHMDVRHDHLNKLVDE